MGGVGVRLGVEVRGGGRGDVGGGWGWIRSLGLEGMGWWSVSGEGGGGLWWGGGRGGRE